MKDDCVSNKYHCASKTSGLCPTDILERMAGVPKRSSCLRSASCSSSLFRHVSSSLGLVSFHEDFTSLAQWSGIIVVVFA